MKNNGIKCKLYSISNAEGKIKSNKIYNAKIIGKGLFISILEEEYESDSEEFFYEYSFNYSYNIPFDHYIPCTGKKKNKLNTKIIYSIVDSQKTEDTIYYSNLRLFDKLAISFNFNRLWI